MKLFSKQRTNAMGAKRFGNYVLYAIGEIVLVVIGILIAVSINNWNEERSNERYLANILRTYNQDLVTDTTNVSITLQRLKEQERLFKLFMSDSVSAATYALNPQGYGLILSYAPLELQKKGIGLLENYSDANEMKSDSLVNRIITSHQAFNHLIDVAQQRISDDIDGNLEYFKNNQLWLSDLFKGTITPEITAYFLSENYENRLAVHSVLVNGNLMPFLTAYQENARSLLEELEERLQ